MSGIFISYRRHDSQSAAGRLADFLERSFGADQIFRDVETIEPGVDFVQAIEKAIASCQVMLVVIGPRWLTITDQQGNRRLDKADDWIRIETKLALQRNIRVIPVLVENAQPPTMDALPDEIKSLARREAHELSDKRWDYDVQCLIEALEKIPGIRRKVQTTTFSQNAPVQPVTTRLTTKLGKVLAWIGGIFVALIMIGVFLDDTTTSITPPLSPPLTPVTPQPLMQGLPSGSPTSTCGCWGYVEVGATRPNAQCASGIDTVVMCQGVCAGGGAPWQSLCQ